MKTLRSILLGVLLAVLCIAAFGQTAEELAFLTSVGDPYPPIPTPSVVPQVTATKCVGGVTTAVPVTVQYDAPEGARPPTEDYIGPVDHFTRKAAPVTRDPVYTITVYDQLGDTNNIMVEITKTGATGFYKAELK